MTPTLDDLLTHKRFKTLPVEKTSVPSGCRPADLRDDPVVANADHTTPSPRLRNDFANANVTHFGQV